MSSRFVSKGVRLQRPVNSWVGQAVRGVTVPPPRASTSDYQARMVRGVLAVRGPVCFIDGRQVDRSTVRLASDLERSIVPASQAIHHGAELIAVAVTAVLDGDEERAREILRSIPEEPFRSRWTTAEAEYALRHDPNLHRHYEGPTVGKSIPRAIERAIQERDGWRCRYCGIKVVEPKVLNVLAARFPEVFPKTSKDATTHPAYWGLRYVAEHVVPRASGGQNTEANLCVACWPCNGAKYNCSLEELFLANPFDFDPPPDDEWDGLSSKLPPLLQ